MRALTPSATASAGLVVAAVREGSIAERAGFGPGDTLLAIDGLVPRDVIDLQLELPGAHEVHVRSAAGEQRTIEVRAWESVAGVQLDPNDLELVEPVPGGIRECNNHCEFCFIRGLPRGLRPTLYVFDDDYRYSFLWGNFLTLTNLDEADWHRIGYQRLSPLNVSVHATDPEVRRRLLNNRHAPPVLPQLQRLAGMGIRLNTQVVLCAGINDAGVLDRTIEDLAGLYPSVQSLSVVPVGLTRFSRVRNIQRPTGEEARRTLEQCERWQTVLRPRFGVGFVYPSDELLLAAGRTEVPPAAFYDGFPILSNGVGMLRSMLDEWDRLLRRVTSSRGGVPAARKVVWVTGRLAAPALEAMADRWQSVAGWRPDVEVVDNDFFGSQVSVSGLLAGADLVRALRGLPTDVEAVVLPRGAFGFDGRRTLDGVTAEAVGAAHPGAVHLASTPRELAAILGLATSRRSRRRV